MSTSSKALKRQDGAGSEPINLALRSHQSHLGDWAFSDLLGDLHCWGERLIIEFKLDIGVPAVQIERLRSRYGHFRRGRNGFGLIDEIAIDERHARLSPYWRVLGTLFHELLHAWQERWGRSGKHNYHNKQFRTKARSLGLIIDQRGYTTYAPPVTPFSAFLDKYGVSLPEIPASESVVSCNGRSKLKLYECQCLRPFKVRVARSSFRAVCCHCGSPFELRE